MTTRPSAELRRQVEERAHQRCKYCLVPQELAASRHQVDHVIAEKHGGQTTLDNLALSCTVCNRRKGSDIGSLDPDSGTLIPLFNPRTQQWSDHFQIGKKALYAQQRLRLLEVSRVKALREPAIDRRQ